MADDEDDEEDEDEMFPDVDELDDYDDDDAIDESNLPSGDSLAADFERYLREHGDE
jgi:hypothetical protein